MEKCINAKNEKVPAEKRRLGIFEFFARTILAKFQQYAGYSCPWGCVPGSVSKEWLLWKSMECNAREWGLEGKDDESCAANERRRPIPNPIALAFVRDTRDYLRLLLAAARFRRFLQPPLEGGRRRLQQSPPQRSAPAINSITLLCYKMEYRPVSLCSRGLRFFVRESGQAAALECCCHAFTFSRASSLDAALTSLPHVHVYSVADPRGGTAPSQHRL